MVEAVSFETEKYRFYFYEDEHFSRTQTVKAHIVRVDGIDVAENDENELRLFFNDMGKWENLRTSLRNLLDDLGMTSRKGTEETVKEFGLEKYRVEWDKNAECVMIEVRLSPDERHRRSKEKKKSAEFSLIEVTEQVTNIPKWRLLKKTLSDFRKQI